MARQRKRSGPGPQRSKRQKVAKTEPQVKQESGNRVQVKVLLMERGKGATYEFCELSMNSLGSHTSFAITKKMGGTKAKYTTFKYPGDNSAITLSEALAESLWDSIVEEMKAKGFTADRKAPKKESKKKIKTEPEDVDMEDAEEEEEEEKALPPRRSSRASKRKAAAALAHADDDDDEEEEEEEEVKVVRGGRLGTTANRFVMLTNTQGTHNKFYEVVRRGTKVTCRYGRIGTSGVTLAPDKLGSLAKAEKIVNDKIKEKTRKGYTVVTDSPDKEDNEDDDEEDSEEDEEEDDDDDDDSDIRTVRVVYQSGNSHKFYQMMRKGVHLVKNWGRVGATGQFKYEKHSSQARADMELNKVEAQKRSKGYTSARFDKLDIPLLKTAIHGSSSSSSTSKAKTRPRKAAKATGRKRRAPTRKSGRKRVKKDVDEDWRDSDEENEEEENEEEAEAQEVEEISSDDRVVNAMLKKAVKLHNQAVQEADGGGDTSLVISLLSRARVWYDKAVNREEDADTADAISSQGAECLRLMERTENQAKQAKKKAKSGSKGKGGSGSIFAGLTFSMSGALSMTRAKFVATRINPFGGNFSNSLTRSVNYLVSTRVDVRSGQNSKIVKAKGYGIPIVQENFVNDSIEANKLQDHKNYLLVDGTSDDEEEEDNVDNEDVESEEDEDEEQDEEDPADLDNVRVENAKTKKFYEYTLNTKTLRFTTVYGDIGSEGVKKVSQMMSLESGQRVLRNSVKAKKRLGFAEVDTH